MKLCQEKCCEIIAFAAAELRDLVDGFHSTNVCPILAALGKADPKKAES